MKRSKPLARKSPKRKTTKTPRCSKQRCGKKALHDGLCKQHLIAACDDMARALKRQEVTACARCGSTQSLQWSHHLSRRFMVLRWEPGNATMHCAPCHALLTHNPFMHVEWIKSYIGEQQYAALYADAYNILEVGTVSFGLGQLEDWYDRLRKEVA